MAEWTPTVDSVERLDDRLLGVGLRAKPRQPKLPRAVWAVTEIVDGTSFAWKDKGPGTRTVGRHQAVPNGAGSTVMLSTSKPGRWVLWRRSCGAS